MPVAAIRPSSCWVSVSKPPAIVPAGLVSAISTSIALVGVAAMLIFIVPVFEAMFADLGSSLPAPTQLLVDLSHAMPVVVPVALVVGIIFSIWWARNKNTDAVRKVLDPVKLKVPVFGKLNTKIALTRFTRNFATMLASGVPLMQSLSIVGATSGNYVITSSLERSVGVASTPEGPFVHEQLAMGVNDNAGCLNERIHRTFFASRLAPAGLNRCIRTA